MTDANPVSSVTRALETAFRAMRRDLDGDEMEGGEGEDRYHAYLSARHRVEWARRKFKEDAETRYKGHRVTELRDLCRSRGVSRARTRMTKPECVNALVQAELEAAIKTDAAMQMPPYDDEAFYLGLPPGLSRRLAMLEAIVVTRLEEMKEAVDELKTEVETHSRELFPEFIWGQRA